MSNQIPTRLGPRPAVRTGAVHRLSREEPIPSDIQPLAADFYRVGVFGIAGDQHNPCIFLHQGALKIVIRVLNVETARSDNYVAAVGPDWELLDAKPIRSKVMGAAKGPIRVPLSMTPLPPLEDLRVFEWQKRLWAIGATHDGFNGNPIKVIRQVLMELGSDGSGVLQHQVIPSERFEKNWMPCIDSQGDLHLVYSVDPLITIRVTPGAVPSAITIPQTTGLVRGGSQLIPFDDGYVALVHEVYKPQQVATQHNSLLGTFWAPSTPDPIVGTIPIVYLHRFAAFDADLSEVSLSRPFYFSSFGIEFCAGLVEYEGSFIASFGAADKECWLAKFGAGTIREMFAEPVVDTRPLDPNELGIIDPTEEDKRWDEKTNPETFIGTK